jgi:hypothetical protein
MIFVILIPAVMIGGCSAPAGSQPDGGNPTVAPGDGWNIDTTQSVADSNAAVQKIAGYLQAGDMKGFNSSLSRNNLALIGGEPKVPADEETKVGAAMKAARMTSASIEVVYYEMVVDGTSYPFSMIKEGNGWKLDAF